MASDNRIVHSHVPLRTSVPTQRVRLHQPGKQSGVERIIERPVLIKRENVGDFVPYTEDQQIRKMLNGGSDVLPQ